MIWYPLAYALTLYVTGIKQNGKLAFRKRERIYVIENQNYLTVCFCLKLIYNQVKWA